MLTAFPVRWTVPEVRQTLALLTETIYRDEDIVKIVQEAGLPIGKVRLEARSELTWRSVFEVAAGQGRVPQLLDSVADAQPSIRLRLEELRADEPVLTTDASVPVEQLDPSAVSWKNFSTHGQNEAVIVAGQPTFVDIGFLARGITRSRSVCRLVTRFPAGNGSGTGFRVGQDHLLTNHHVLFDHRNNNAPATMVEAWFNYEDDEMGSPKEITQIVCDASTVVGEESDDWALVRVGTLMSDEFPILPLTDAAVPMINERVYIIQHPAGGPKQIAFQHNLVRAVTHDVLQYWTDTDLGSSGSPVFDEDWRVVGLHHFSVKAETDSMGVRNQGRRIDRIVERIRARKALPELMP